MQAQKSGLAKPTKVVIAAKKFLAGVKDQPEEKAQKTDAPKEEKKASNAKLARVSS